MDYYAPEEAERMHWTQDPICGLHNYIHRGMGLATEQEAHAAREEHQGFARASRSELVDGYLRSHYF